MAAVSCDATFMSNNSRIILNTSKYRRVFSALHDSNYRLLWGSNFAMYLSRWMQMTVLSWFVLNLTESPFKVGIVGFCGMAPNLVLGIFGGYLADKLDRKKLLSVTQILNLIAAMAMTFLLVSGIAEYWHAYIAIIFPGLGWALDMPSRKSLMMDLMGSDGLTNGIAFDSVGMHMSKMIGPAVAGTMIAFVSISSAYVFLCVCIFMGCIFIFRVKQPEKDGMSAQASYSREKIGSKGYISLIFKNLGEGFRYAFSNHVIVAVIVITVFMNLLLFPYMTMVTVVSKVLLEVGPFLMGILIASDGLGALLGSVLIAAQSGMKSHGRVFFYGSILSLISLLLFSISGWYLLSVFALIFLGCGTAGFGTMQSTIVLLVSNSEYRGRVLGTVTIAIGAGPIGALIIGALSENIGVANALLINAFLGLVIVGFCGMIMPSIRQDIDVKSP